MSEKKLLTGNYAAAYAVSDCDVDVISAYPITPQSSVAETLSELIEKELLDSEFVTVESEHSAMTVCISASAMGSRVFTASSSQGLALMHEQIHWAAGARLPIVMCCVNRGIGAPWTILNDQQDSISQRDTGWIQLYVSNNQEIYDTVIQAYRLAEEINVPVMVCYDGFILSHRSMPVAIETREKVQQFLPKLDSKIKIDFDNPKNVTPVVLAGKMPDKNGKLHNGYMEFRHLLATGNDKAIELIEKINQEFLTKFGRSYHNGLFKTYNMEDAEDVIVTMGSLGSESISAVNSLRKKGIKCGLVNIRSYRPFPGKILSETLKNAKNIVVFDKNISYGHEGALCSDLKSSLYTFKVFGPSVLGVICGLGGRNISYTEIAETIEKFKNKKLGNEKPYWLNSNPE